MIRTLAVQTGRQGLHEITRQIESVVADSAIKEGLCTIFIRHTSASLTIQENADPSARHDLERWLNRLVPLNDPEYTHISEGEDDMPSHIKSVLTSTTLAIPITDGRLALGTWQGIFVWEHRKQSSQRSLVMHLSGD